MAVFFLVFFIIVSLYKLQVNPGWDSFAIASSNLLYVTYKAVVEYFVKIHCESEVGVAYILNSLSK